MKKTFLPCLLAVTLAACSSDDNTNEEIPKARPISVVVTENSLQDNTNGARQDTRAEATTTSSLERFKMNYGAGMNYSVQKYGKDWKFNGADDASWPGVGNDAEVTFYAYSYPGSDPSTTNPDYNYYSGNPYLSFSQEENASAQHDLLVATRTTTFNAHQGKVYLTFDHACAAADFQIAITSGVSAKGVSVAIQKIELCNIMSSGDYSFAEGWSNLSNLTNYTLYDSNMSLSTESQAVPGGYLFIIPQTVTAYDSSSNTSGAYYRLTLTVSGSGVEKVGIIPFSQTYIAGEIFPTTILVGTSLKDASGNKIFN